MALAAMVAEADGHDVMVCMGLVQGFWRGVGWVRNALGEEEAGSDGWAGNLSEEGGGRPREGSIGWQSIGWQTNESVPAAPGQIEHGSDCQNTCPSCLELGARL